MAETSGHKDYKSSDRNDGQEMSMKAALIKAIMWLVTV